MLAARRLAIALVRNRPSPGAQFITATMSTTADPRAALTTSVGPVEQAIRAKVCLTFQPPPNQSSSSYPVVASRVRVYIGLMML